MQCNNVINTTPSLHGYYPTSALLPVVPPPVPGFGTLALVGLPLGHLPLHPDDRFPGSLREPEPSSRRLYAGRHVGSKQVAPTLIPGRKSPPGSDVI